MSADVINGNPLTKFPLSLGREEAARVRAHFNNPGKHSSRILEAANSYYYGNGSAPASPRVHHHRQSESFSSLPPNVDCPPPPDER